MYYLREFVKGRRGVDNDPHFLLPLYSGEIYSVYGVIVTTNIGVDNGSHFFVGWRLMSRYMFLNHPKVFWKLRRLNIWFFNSSFVAFICAFGGPALIINGVVWLIG